MDDNRYAVIVLPMSILVSVELNINKCFIFGAVFVYPDILKLLFKYIKSLVIVWFPKINHNKDGNQNNRKMTKKIPPLFKISLFFLVWFGFMAYQPL